MSGWAPMSGSRTGRGIIDEEPENSPAVWQVADGGVLLRTEAVGYELDEPPVIADHADGAVPRAGEPARGDHDALQCHMQLEVRADPDHRIQQRPQPLAVGKHVADPVEQLLQQLL